MKGDTEISDRHLLKLVDLEDVAEREQQAVRIVVSDPWAASVAGQLLVSSLVNLLCRQVKLIGYIEIVAKSSETMIELPNGNVADAFPGCLESLTRWAVEDAIKISTTKTDNTIDHTVYVG